MCRWLAYSGSPIVLSRALYTPAHSLIDQSLHSTMGAEPTNGDGFGIGWYDAMPEPGVFHSIEPAWKDQNLHELAGHIYPEREILHEVSADARLVVSEPMGDLPGAWNEVPESSYGVVGHGDDQLRPFKVKPPNAAAVTV